MFPEILSIEKQCLVISLPSAKCEQKQLNINLNTNKPIHTNFFIF